MMRLLVGVLHVLARSASSEAMRGIADCSAMARRWAPQALSRLCGEVTRAARGTAHRARGLLALLVRIYGLLKASTPEAVVRECRCPRGRKAIHRVLRFAWKGMRLGFDRVAKTELDRVTWGYTEYVPKCVDRFALWQLQRDTDGFLAGKRVSDLFGKDVDCTLATTHYVQRMSGFEQRHEVSRWYLDAVGLRTAFDDWHAGLLRSLFRERTRYFVGVWSADLHRDLKFDTTPILAWRAQCDPTDGPLLRCLDYLLAHGEFTARALRFEHELKLRAEAEAEAERRRRAEEEARRLREEAAREAERALRLQRERELRELKSVIAVLRQELENSEALSNALTTVPTTQPGTLAQSNERVGELRRLLSHATTALHEHQRTLHNVNR